MSDDPKDLSGPPEDFDLFGVEPLPVEEDDSLLAGLVDDKRLGSGVPESQRLSEVDFIAMSGITRPMPKAKAAPAPPSPSEEESEALISFAEPGVRDVDENEVTEPLARGAVALPPEDETPGEEAGEDPYAPVTPAPVEDDAPKAAAFVSLEDEAGTRVEAEEQSDAEQPVEGVDIPQDAPDAPSHEVRFDGDEHDEEAGEFIEDSISPPEAEVELAPPAEDFSVLLEAIESEETVDLPPPVNSGEAEHAAEPAIEGDVLRPAPPAAARWKLEEAEQLLHLLSTQPREPEAPEAVTPETESIDDVPPEVCGAEPESSSEEEAPRHARPEPEPVPAHAALLETEAFETAEPASEVVASSGPEGEGDLLDQFLQAVETSPEAPTPTPPPQPASLLDANDDGEEAAEPEVATERTPLWSPDPEPVVEKEAPPLIASHAPPVVDKHSAGRHGHVEYEYEAAPSRRTTTRQVRRRRRLIIRAGALLAAVALAAAGYLAYRELLHPRILNPDELYAKAQRQLADRRFAEASALFAEFAQRAPGHPARPDAQFAAALALHMAPRGSAEMNRAHAAQAIEYLEAFIRDNPAHKKLARARTLLGMLYYQAEDYERAIETLRELVRKPEDQLAALPLTRTLARAYGYTGAIEEAEATYLQATSLPRNYTPDADYFELGELYRRRAELAEPGEEKARLQAQAEHYLGLASETSVIDPETRESIGELMLSLSAPATDAEEPPPVTGVVEPAAPEAPPVKMVETPPVASGVVLDPVMEAQQLGQPAVAQP